MAYPLLSKQAARYRGDGGVEHCSLCRFFSPVRGGRCARVLGDISPRGWCRLFSREMRALIADVSQPAGIGGGPSLSLDFMRPGTLDPRITFTRASTGTYFDAAGVMQTAAINTPRWDYDPATLQLRGLLLEDQRTNSIANSGDFTGAGYTKSNATVTSSPGGAAPNGSNLMLVAENTNPAAHAFYGGAITTTAALWTVSAFVRAGTQRYISLRGDTLGGTNLPWITLDTQTGTIAANASVTASGVQALPGGTFRIWLTWLAVAGTSNVLLGGNNSATPPAPSNGLGASYASTAATTWYAWGLQVELGDFATSYIPTTTVAVTRNIDSCLIPPANMAPWFVAPGGSWFAEFDYFDATPSNSRVIGRPDTAGGVSPLLLNASRNVVQNDGATLATANATTAGAITKACSTWAAGSARICANGGAVASSASLATGYGAFTAAGVRLLSVGAALGSDNTSGHIRAVRYWPSILSDAAMQTITT